MTDITSILECFVSWPWQSKTLYPFWLLANKHFLICFDPWKLWSLSTFVFSSCSFRPFIMTMQLCLFFNINLKASKLNTWYYYFMLVGVVIPDKAFEHPTNSQEFHLLLTGEVCSSTVVKHNEPGSDGHIICLQVVISWIHIFGHNVIITRSNSIVSVRSDHVITQAAANRTWMQQ